MKTKEVTTWGYSRDGTKWVNGYATQQEALQAAAEDLRVTGDLPATVCIGQCTPASFNCIVGQRALAFALVRDDPAAFLVDAFIMANAHLAIDPRLFENLDADDDLRDALHPAVTPEEASEALHDWLEHRSWLPGSRVLDVCQIQEFRLREDGT